MTTVTRQNLPYLQDGRIWVLGDSQIGLPMGNLKERPEWLITPSEVDDIIDFCYDTMKDGRIRIYPADCIGYFNKQEQEVRRVSYQTTNTEWDGCNAGIRGFGILQNGDVLGCTSIRSREFIEGNLRERSLSDIWNDPKSFSWRRTMTKKQLSGFCGHCVYGSKCLGGCANTRLTMEGSIYGENKYCSYHHHIGNLEAGIALRTDIDRMFTDAGGAFHRKTISRRLCCASVSPIWTIVMRRRINSEAMSTSCAAIIQIPSLPTAGRWSCYLKMPILSRDLLWHCISKADRKTPCSLCSIAL